ncbi:hypothetical protein Pelo_2483 [Pelomyxa schiedti]|nr:hypothetical protein Pelo_2483 [Pelomyxa schiedti]
MSGNGCRFISLTNFGSLYLAGNYSMTLLYQHGDSLGPGYLIAETASVSTGSFHSGFLAAQVEITMKCSTHNRSLIGGIDGGLLENFGSLEITERGYLTSVTIHNFNTLAIAQDAVLTGSTLINSNITEIGQSSSIASSIIVNQVGCVLSVISASSESSQIHNYGLLTTTGETYLSYLANNGSVQILDGVLTWNGENNAEVHIVGVLKGSVSLRNNSIVDGPGLLSFTSVSVQAAGLCFSQLQIISSSIVVSTNWNLSGSVEIVSSDLSGGGLVLIPSDLSIETSALSVDMVCQGSSYLQGEITISRTIACSEQCTMTLDSAYLKSGSSNGQIISNGTVQQLLPCDSYFYVPLYGTGSVHVQHGNLYIASGGICHQINVDIGIDAELHIISDCSLFDSSISGQGRILVASARFYSVNVSCNMVNTGTLLLSVVHCFYPVTLSGIYQGMANNSILILHSGASIVASVRFSEISVTNFGTLTYTAGNFILQRSQVNNYGVLSSSSTIAQLGETSKILNIGTCKLWSSYIQCTFENPGQILAESGSSYISALISTGIVDVKAKASLELVSANLSSTNTLRGAGSVILTGSKTLFSGTTHISSAILNSSTTIANITIYSSVEWGGGKLSGLVVTYGDLRLVGDNHECLNCTILIKTGSLHINGSFTLSGYSHIYNIAGILVLNSCIVSNPDRTASIENNKTIDIPVGVSAVVNALLINNGTINMQGNATFGGGGINKNACRLSSNSYLSILGSTFVFQNTSALTGGGFFIVATSCFLSGLVSVQVQIHSYLAVSGVYFLDKVLLITGAMEALDSRPYFIPWLEVKGKSSCSLSNISIVTEYFLLQSGSLKLSNSHLEIAVDGNFISTATTISGDGIIANYGTAVFNSATTFFMDVTFQNNGTALIQKGDLLLRGGGFNAGNLTISVGCHIRIRQFSLLNSSFIQGKGEVALENGIYNIAGISHCPVVLAGGTVSCHNTFITEKLQLLYGSLESGYLQSPCVQIGPSNSDLLLSAVTVTALTELKIKNASVFVDISTINNYGLLYWEMDHGLWSSGVLVNWGTMLWNSSWPFKVNIESYGFIYGYFKMDTRSVVIHSGIIEIHDSITADSLQVKNGSFTGNGTCQFASLYVAPEGYISPGFPGHPFGFFSFGNFLVFEGTYTIQIGGTSKGDYDRISATAFFAGGLSAEFLPNFIPVIGDKFEVAYGSLSYIDYNIPVKYSGIDPQAVVAHANDTSIILEIIGCTEGFYNITSCRPCGTGHYYKNYSCFDCPLGTFSNTTIAFECNLCPSGTFSNSSGASFCTPCSDNSYTLEIGETYCSPCPEGYEKTGNEINCTACLPGQKNSIPGGYCNVCPAGTISNSTGASECWPCQSGSTPNDLHTQCLEINYSLSSSGTSPPSIYTSSLEQTSTKSSSLSHSISDSSESIPLSSLFSSSKKLSSSSDPSESYSVDPSSVSFTSSDPSTSLSSSLPLLSTSLSYSSSPFVSSSSPESSSSIILESSSQLSLQQSPESTMTSTLSQSSSIPSLSVSFSSQDLESQSSSQSPASSRVPSSSLLSSEFLSSLVSSEVILSGSEPNLISTASSSGSSSSSDDNNLVWISVVLLALPGLLLIAILCKRRKSKKPTVLFGNPNQPLTSPVAGEENEMPTLQQASLDPSTDGTTFPSAICGAFTSPPIPLRDLSGASKPDLPSEPDDTLPTTMPQYIYDAMLSSLRHLSEPQNREINTTQIPEMQKVVSSMPDDTQCKPLGDLQKKSQSELENEYQKKLQRAKAEKRSAQLARQMYEEKARELQEYMDKMEQDRLNDRITTTREDKSGVNGGSRVVHHLGTGLVPFVIPLSRSGRPSGYLL